MRALVSAYPEGIEANDFDTLSTLAVVFQNIGFWEEAWITENGITLFEGSYNKPKAMMKSLVIVVEVFSFMYYSPLPYKSSESENLKSMAVSPLTIKRKKRAMACFLWTRKPPCQFPDKGVLSAVDWT